MTLYITKISALTYAYKIYAQEMNHNATITSPIYIKLNGLREVHFLF
jgi:hypothetical protein